MNPVHYFTQGGEYEVKVFVQYPNGRIEETSRVVTVIESPHPDLGPDTLKCEMGNIVLNAGDEEGMFVWSNGTFGHNATQITVSDTGWYWVQVTNRKAAAAATAFTWACTQKPLLTKTTCALFPPPAVEATAKYWACRFQVKNRFRFEWFDADRNLLGSTLDLINLPVGNYFLHILDGNGCTTISDAYTIEDAGDIEISFS